MRLSKMHLKTLREVPAEAEIPSHILLLRTGMIRRQFPVKSSAPPISTINNPIGNTTLLTMRAADASEAVQLAIWLPRPPRAM